MLDIFFSAPVVSCLLVAACAAFGVSVVVRFMPDKRRLENTMQRAEKALLKLRTEIATKEATIQQLQSEVEMLKPLHDRLSNYHEDLTQMRLDLERQDLSQDDSKTSDVEDEVFGRRKRHKV